MSVRTLFEINHDYGDRFDAEAIPFLHQYLRSGSRRDAEVLERFGLRVVGMRHHADNYVIDGRADGFPARYLNPPKDPQ